MMMGMGEEERRTTELVLNGIVVGEMEVTGDFEKDAALTIQFLKNKGLYQKPDPVKTMFRQALSFATTASHLHKKGLLHRPWNVFDVAPFVVNSAFSIELYLKTLARSHGTILKGHDLLKLLGSLPAAAHSDIGAVLPACRLEFPPAGNPDLSTCVAELSNAFVEWRYLHEKMRTIGIRIDRAIFVMPRRRNLWVTETVEGCRGRWARLPAGTHCRMVRSFGSFPSQLSFEPVGPPR